jgi:IclR family acetate operon transcriptional repressor
MKTQKPVWSVPSGAYTVKSLLKALAILEFLAEGDQSGYTLTQLSRGLRLHVSTVHRLLVNLLRQGFVEQDGATGSYQLSFQVLRMGLKVLARLDFRRVAEPLLRQLNRQTQETVQLAILRGDKVVPIEKFGSLQPVGLDAPLGGILPLHSTGVGKAILAYQEDEFLKRLAVSPGLERYTPHTITMIAQLKKELAKVREEGYSIDNEETVEGLRCVAAPVFDHSGNVVASFSVAGPATRLVPARLPAIARWVRETSRQISFRLGYSFPQDASPAARAKQRAESGEIAGGKAL